VYGIVGYRPTAESYLTPSFTYVKGDERWYEKCPFESENVKTKR